MDLFGIKKKKNKNKTLKYIKSVVPMKKFGTIDDIFELCIFIENNKSQFASGSTYILDGGQTKTFKFYEQSKIR